MAHDIPGAQWPRFMLQVQEIKKKSGTRDRYNSVGRWCPPLAHQARSRSGINASLFYCDATSIHTLQLQQGQLNNDYRPLPTFSIYHNQREVFALQGDVLDGRGALGPTLEEHDSEDEEAGQAWQHINFMHRPNPDNSSFVGVAGNSNSLNPYGLTSAPVRRLIPMIYHAEQELGRSGGLDGHVQLLLGLFRLFEDPREERYTSVTGMDNGSWWVRPRLPTRPDQRGIVVRVWALPGDDPQTLEDFGEGIPHTVFT